MSCFELALSPLLETYTASEIGRVWKLLALLARFGSDGVLTLRSKTIAKNLRLPTKTPDKLLSFLHKMQGDLLLDGYELDGELLTVEASEWFLPPSQTEADTEAEEWQLLPQSLEEAGRSRCQTKSEQNRRQRKSRRNSASLNALLEQNASLTPHSSQPSIPEPVPLASDVTAFSQENEQMSQFSAPMSQPQTVTLPKETVTSHTQRADHDQDRSDPDRILLQKDQDQDHSESKRSGETNAGTMALETVTLPEQSVTGGQKDAALPEWEREVIALLSQAKEQWTQVEIREALRRMKEQMERDLRAGKPPIHNKLKYLKPILAQVRGEGFDQQRARMLQGAIPGGKASPALRVREPGSIERPEPWQNKPTDAPAIQALRAKRTGTEG